MILSRSFEQIKVLYVMGFENRRHSQAHPLGPKREAGPIKHPGPERRPKKEKPSSLAPEAYDVDN